MTGPSLARLSGFANYSIRGARLLAGFVGDAPIHCIVQVSNRCPLTCSFCSFWENPAHRDDEITTEEFVTISSKLAEAGSMIVSLEGGEPLLRPDAVEIVRAFARHHHPILFTSGWRVNEPLARELFAAGLTGIGVSIDYADPERHDAHRGARGTFDAAVRAATILREQAPEGRRQVTLMTVVMHDNLGELERLLQLSAALGVNHQVTLISVGGDGRHEGAQHAPPPGAGAHLLELKQRYPHFVTFTGYLEGIDPYLAGRAPKRCDAGLRFLNVDHLGWVSPCIEKLHLRAGNLRRDPWPVIAERLRALEEPRSCNACLTSCKGFVEEMAGRPRARSYRELFGGFASTAQAGREGR